MALQVHFIDGAAFAATITIRPAIGKVGKFWYAKVAGVGGNGSLTFNGETGTKILQASGGNFEWGENIFGEGTNYQKFELTLDHNNYITIDYVAGAPVATYSVYWVES